MGSEQASEWAVVTEAYNPDEAQLICGLLTMAAIPVKMEKEPAADIYGLTIGPLARIQILVPSSRIADAEKILTGQVDDGEEALE